MGTLETQKINGRLIVSIWLGEDLFKSGDRRGLALLEDDTWVFVERVATGLSITDVPYEKEFLIDSDKLWGIAFEAIRAGLNPFWSRRVCTCGAHATYGRSYMHHSSICWLNDPNHYTNSPKNNDGRERCLKCGEKTSYTPGWNSVHNLCQNPECGWYKN